jgi:hypothetical protein
MSRTRADEGDHTECDPSDRRRGGHGRGTFAGAFSKSSADELSAVTGSAWIIITTLKI